ncbi:hypothetical protein A2Y83_03545 [Candidatus Falkowbacteria bacterium RBG_13_39_14]|uniref:Glutaredoxin domain-containing protein n=1 Tax=Candidatus Falkowbacteria bacterium RBG_13_39_14 TaxID=1797985 RepID=A0A1F5S5T3_9BACT|nr:MAG: hypothetical protein A2Y83_03545 [Candidatus Falkowbacteria bacterium RBG_13_39_14]
MFRVTIYTNSDCVDSMRVKEFLKRHRVEFLEKDVAKNEKAAEEMAKKSGQLASPVIVARISGKDRVILGADEGMIRNVLRI